MSRRWFVKIGSPRKASPGSRQIPLAGPPYLSGRARRGWVLCSPDSLRVAAVAAGAVPATDDGDTDESASSGPNRRGGSTRTGVSSSSQDSHRAAHELHSPRVLCLYGVS
jgi:hypothetical protein